MRQYLTSILVLLSFILLYVMIACLQILYQSHEIKNILV